MAREYHDEFLHVIVDCKTGNEILDQSVESTILGYVYLVVYCLEKDKFDQLIAKSGEMAVEFSEQKA